MLALVAGAVFTACHRSEGVSSTSADAEIARARSAGLVEKRESRGLQTAAAGRASRSASPHNNTTFTQHEGTEAPFRNAFWNNHEPGLYVDIVSGEPLFSSADKSESGTGWPSFTRPIDPARSFAVRTARSVRLRTEGVLSDRQSSHLGHVFNLMARAHRVLATVTNSASLRFIPVKDLAEQG